MTLDGARYVAIITDGNRRWARQRDLPVGEGHRAAAENVRARLRDAVELGVEELTIYAFSTENWERPSQEVDGLLALLAEYIDAVTPELHEEGVRLRFIGDRGAPLPPSLVERMERAEALTDANRRISFFVPFNYGGRAEIVRAAAAFDGGDEDEFARGLYAPEMHNPQLMIRTSGERRLSNYLLWQLADSELIFREELWPDFSRRAFEEALQEYRRRRDRRRPGGRQGDPSGLG
ncbi:MAG TPA: polyprenyl diphosphate synthase [Solirubrobacterales bacterium]|nr:polyprenyl diphosphate synthase [Solirubrobacterales bacterium]